MVKAEIIESPEVSKETELIATDNVPNVDVAIEQWDAYQKLCKGLLNETDYQEIIVKEKDENGNYVKVKRHFKKKSAWQKLSRAFNVDTEIVDREIERTKMGRVREAYYCVRATLMLIPILLIVTLKEPKWEEYVKLTIALEQHYQMAVVLNQMHYAPVQKKEKTK